MTERKKFGFSLVEVMIFFTLLAVITAASIPMMTRKSRPTPRSISHGVYVCIRNDSDAESYTEAYYNSFVRLSTNNNAASCSFNIPRADEYKIELYSAGAGGNRHADYTSQQNDARVFDFTRNTAVQYFNNRNNANALRQILSNLSHIPTNQEFKNAFRGTSATISIFSGNAGNGADETVTFRSPSTSHCLLKNGATKQVDTAGVYDANGIAQGNFEYMVDTNNTPLGGIYKSNMRNNSDVSLQLRDFCALKYFDSYDMLNPGSAWSFSKPLSQRAPFLNIGTKNIIQRGGNGGHGRWISLTYNILPDEDRHYTGVRSDYPFLVYFADITNNILGNGYQKASCNEPITTDFSENPENRNLTDFAQQRRGNQNNISTYYPNANICRANTTPPQNAGSGFGRRQTKDFAYNAVRAPFNYYYGRNGNDAVDYAAFRTPRFNNNTNRPLYDGSGEYVTNQIRRALRGEGGIIGIQYANYTFNWMWFRTTIDRGWYFSNNYYDALSEIISAVVTSNPSGCTLCIINNENETNCFSGYKINPSVFNTYLKNYQLSLLKDKEGANNFSLSNYAWQIYRGVRDGDPASENMTKRYAQDRAPNGEDAAIANVNPTRNSTFYNLRAGGAVNEIPDDYPFVRITDNLWTKTYHIGNPGGIGRHATYRASSLGTRCNMIVPRGGRPVEDTTTAQRLAEMQNELSTTMICVDGQGNTLFSQTLQGGQYNRNNRSVTFSWSDEYQRDGFTASSSAAAQMQYFFPQWSRAFNLVNDGVSSLVRGFRVGQAGSGMTVQDRCTVPRGVFSMIPYMQNNPNTPAGIGIQNTQNEGFKNGYQCYNANETLENMENNANLFNITRRADQNGGPGAIIISW